MRHAVLAFAAAATLAGLAPSAFAQAPAADSADTRCVLVLQAVSRDPGQRDNAVRGVYYYMGKLATRGPVSRLDPVMLAEGKKMGNAQQVQAELTRCGNELSQRSGEFQTMNQRLAKQFGPPPAAAAPAKK
ncbi:MAG: hypothetical protein KKE02_04630 [Alphaproteobacteria bacterium]|nr:hypothetical protein [Alphaproteobacteria bacterium]MBU1513706.1 hypothetical protein [Alphaproteobacteria bacterium]MBU2094649.1 hypothetical protein [Alphaproteobacteria bacterium]MBU2150282.1 hypothetical protein [Alphaproteobacteria bacterium]MBU2309189.1 hypothetical protein [Alphaproteobacteria bacterium]